MKTAARPRRLRYRRVLAALVVCALLIVGLVRLRETLRWGTAESLAHLLALQIRAFSLPPSLQDRLREPFATAVARVRSGDIGLFAAFRLMNGIEGGPFRLVLLQEGLLHAYADDLSEAGRSEGITDPAALIRSGFSRAAREPSSSPFLASLSALLLKTRTITLDTGLGTPLYDRVIGLKPGLRRPDLVRCLQLLQTLLHAPNNAVHPGLARGPAAASSSSQAQSQVRILGSQPSPLQTPISVSPGFAQGPASTSRSPHAQSQVRPLGSEPSWLQTTTPASVANPHPLPSESTDDPRPASSHTPQAATGLTLSVPGEWARLLQTVGIRHHPET